MSSQCICHNVPHWACENCICRGLLGWTGETSPGIFCITHTEMFKRLVFHATYILCSHHLNRWDGNGMCIYIYITIYDNIYMASYTRSKSSIYSNWLILKGSKLKLLPWPKTTECESCHVAQEIIIPQVIWIFNQQRQLSAARVFSGETWWASFWNSTHLRLPRNDLAIKVPNLSMGSWKIETVKLQRVTLEVFPWTNAGNLTFPAKKAGFELVDALIKYRYS